MPEPGQPRDTQPAVMDELISLVYEELRRMARRELARRRPGDTLDTSALVHEAWLKMAGADRGAWNDESHFLAVAATAMRHIIIDYARRKGSGKHGGGQRLLTLDDRHLIPEEQVEALLGLDEALDRLAQLDSRLSRVVECRFFAGLTVADTAAALDRSPRSIDRDWQKAKAWLYRELSGA